MEWIENSKKLHVWKITCFSYERQLHAPNRSIMSWSTHSPYASDLALVHWIDLCLPTKFLPHYDHAVREYVCNVLLQSNHRHTIKFSWKLCPIIVMSPLLYISWMFSCDTLQFQLINSFIGRQNLIICMLDQTIFAYEISLQFILLQVLAALYFMLCALQKSVIFLELNIWICARWVTSGTINRLKLLDYLLWMKMIKFGTFKLLLCEMH